MKRVGKLLFAGGLVTVVAMSGCRTGFDTDPQFTQDAPDGTGTGDNGGGGDVDPSDEGGGDGVSVDGSTGDASSDEGPGDAITVDIPTGDGGTPAFVCGNGVIEPAAPGAEPNTAEACDQGPGFGENGDGCSKRCRIEPGWWCEGAPSVCYPVCGDGIVIEGLEACDVGNQLGTQGCLADCTAEVEGWDCVYNEELARSVCFAAECGDGIVAGDETCDPPAGVEQPECIGCQLQGCEDADGDGAGIGDFCTFIDCAPFDPEVAPNLEEVCDGKDNNCNDLIDEDITVACGGDCDQGFQYCVDGALSECFGSATVSEEICGDGVDNDCDGFVDNAGISFPCGNAFCEFGEVQACGSDSGAGCPSVEFNPEVCGDGEDNDCDGVVDDGCVASCVWVHPNGGSAANGETPTGEPSSPYGSIQEAIDYASSVDGPPLNVCVQCLNGAYTNYFESVVMAPGVNLLGGFSNPDSPGTCITEISGVGNGGPSVYFPPGVGATPTFMRDMKVKSSGNNDPGSLEPGVTVLVEASGARLADNSIFVPSDNNHHIGIYVSPEANQDGSTPLITATELYYGQSTISVGIRADTRVDIRDMCAGYGEGGTCNEACSSNGSNGIHLNGDYASGDANAQEYVAGIVLNGAAGSTVDQVGICVAGSDNAFGIVIQGKSEDVTITRSAIHAEGAASVAAGVAMDSCEGTQPTVAYNSNISGGSSPAMLGVSAGDGCNARIIHNEAIVGGFEAGFNPDGTSAETIAIGVRCAPDKDSDNINPDAPGDSSLCTIAENEFIVGAYSGSADIAIGVACVRSCELVSRSTMLGAYDSAVAEVAGGLFLAGETPALVDRNTIYGACAAGVSVGVRAGGAQARLTNNVIAGGGTSLTGCNNNPLSDEQTYVGVMVNPTINNLELDVHSNFISGLGAYLGNCQSAAVGYAALELDGTQLDVLPTTPLGLFRNNMLDAGLCLGATSVMQWNDATLPKVFMYNTLLTSSAAWIAPDGTALTEENQVNDVPFAYEGNTVRDQVTLELETLFGTAGIVATLGLQDSGTSHGAPPWDLQGTPRPLGDGYDRGPYEFDETGAIAIPTDPEPVPDPQPGAP